MIVGNYLFQPRINTTTQRISGVEALIRWNSKKLGQISPVEFIPVAENTGQIDKIGIWVLRTVCLEINCWKEQHQLTLPVSINLSARQFKHETLLLSSIDLAHHLGLNVIAEGVETSEQLDFLKKHQCDEIQGYFYNPPLTSHAIVEKYSDVENKILQQIQTTN